MKKLVIFGYNMDMGGAERALLNVINVIKPYFDIDLILIEKKGILLKEVPKEVHIKEIRKNIFSYALFRFIPFFRKRMIRKLTKDNYAMAVAFMEGRCATWLTDMHSSCPKIAWIHNDVNKFDIGIRTQEIKKTYSKLDQIVVVSKQSKQSFCDKYLIDPNKVSVIYNLIDEASILEKAQEFIPTKEEFTFVNVARMRPQKRHDRLLEAASTLKKEGYKFKLWLVGDGPLEKEIKEMITNLHLEEEVVLWGLKENPFPYIKNADFFVLSSDHEGYPLSILESLLLKTPVISTDVSGAREILKNNKYGFICDITLESLTDTMRKVLNEKNFPILEKNLEAYQGSNEEITKQLKKLFMVK